ncbi:MAG: methyltransferase domain-containing protein [Patescibacteria group bacterium]|nr:methyltransferase domain-containing protein [Patescibacteria group bacterium]
MSFNYEQSIWGQGTATLKWSDPASFRLRQCLESFKKIPAGAKVLELGCGAGQFIRALKKIRSAWNCYGCDISQTAIETAKTAHDGVNYDLSTADKLLYPNAYFDAVAFFDVLEHVADPTGLIAEIYRVLKPGGILYAFVPCEGDVLSLWRWLDKFGLKKDLTKKFAGHVNYFSRAEVGDLLAANGFNIIRRRYSEHCLGQKVGIWSFFMMNRAAKKLGGGQINNEQYFARFNGRGASGLKKIGNALINLESFLWQRLPSPNLHITAVKK